MSIKIGNIDVSYFKVGGDDCSIYLGDILLYPQSQPQTLQWVTFSNGDTIPSDLQIYGIKGVVNDLTMVFYDMYTDDIYVEDAGRNKYNVIIGGYAHPCYGEDSIVSDTSVEYIFSNIGCSDYYTVSSRIIDNMSNDIQLYIYDSPTPPTPHDYSQDYLTFRALEDGTFSFSGDRAASANTLEYSLDSGSTWSTLQNSGTTPTVTSGNTILWKASGLTIGRGIGNFSSTGLFEAEGNIMSLLYGDNFSGQTSLNGMNNAFNSLFKDCLTITSAENLILPATALTNNCYNEMFRNCTSLTTAPELPATTLAVTCYGSMFSGCTSLTAAPELLATTLEAGCYIKMFYGCTSLTAAPVLPATTLAYECYYSMFQGCTSLTTVPLNMLPATTLANECYCGMFEGCTSLTTAPELPATTLAESCYYSMFEGCTNLNHIKCLATDMSARYCTGRWTFGVAASGIFIKAENMTSWRNGINGIPRGWTVQDYSS